MHFEAKVMNRFITTIFFLYNLLCANPEPCFHRAVFCQMKTFDYCRHIFVFADHFIYRKTCQQQFMRFTYDDPDSAA